jgi:hypothetical protein
LLASCQHVGLESDGGYCSGNDGTNMTRSGVQWLKLSVNSSSPYLSHSSGGRIFDTATSNPYYYYMPSLTVNSSGDVLVGFSGSKSTERIGAFFSGKCANGATPTNPVLLQAGRDYYTGARIGDFSATTLDPSDGSFWTIQEYAELQENRSVWGTWITSLKTNP